MDYQNYYDGLERMYPDTYRIIYPMVASACDRISMPLTEDMLDRMTDDIYDRSRIACRIDDDDCNSRQVFTGFPRRRNRVFRDLIRILLIRELLRRR